MSPSQQQRPRDTGLALLTMMSLAPLPRAQDPLMCVPADQRPICLASPEPKHALRPPKDPIVVIVTPGVANDGASRVVASTQYANVRGLSVYGNKNDTDPLILWQKGEFIEAAQGISKRIGAGSLPTAPLLGAAILAESGAAAFNVHRIQVPLSGPVNDGINAAYGLTHGLLGAVAEESTEHLSKVIVESLKAGKALELVAHSQGGIITANALVLARNDPRFAAMTDTQWLEATKNISVVCFGTPQRVFNISKVTSYVHDNDPVVSAVNGLRSIPAIAKIAGYIKGVVREKLPIISSPELKPEVVVLGGKNGGSHEFALYLEDLPKFRAQQILARAKGNGAKACDIIVELAERGAASNDQIERTALETFGSVGPKDPTQFQQEFARRFIQYQKQDRINGKHWSQSTQELFYHAQGAAYPWEKPSRLVPKGTRVADLRRQFANPENIDSGIGQSDDERYESDPSLIYNRRNSSAAIAAAAVGHSHAAEDESRRRNDNASSEARMAAQSGMAGVPAQHSDAVNANREHHETVASAPSALTDERSRDFQGQLAERRAVDERSTSAANVAAKEKTEKQAENARDAAADRVASKEKEERDRKAAEEARADESQRAEQTETRVAAAERTAAEAKEEADRASKSAAAAAQKKAPVTKIYNRVTKIIQNFFGREEIPPTPAPPGSPVILP